MKSESYALVNKKVLGNCMSDILERPIDGTIQITISQVTGKSGRQRGLQHIWYGDVIKAGIGDKYESDKELLDLKCKYRWGLPILIRDDTLFAELYLAYSRKFKSDPERMMWFVKTHVHTEQFTQSQMAEYLTMFRDYYGIDLGVNLTDPDQKGWANLLEYAA
jgi:hypothetical protein